MDTRHGRLAWICLIFHTNEFSVLEANVMKVLFLSELFYPHGGGAELATYLYAKLLSERGLNVVVVTNRFPGESEISKRKNLTVHRLSLFKRTTSVKYSILFKIDVLFSSFLKKLIKWADVVYVPRFWYSAIPLAKFYRKSVVVHLHDYLPVCPLSHAPYSAANKPCIKRGFCSLGCIYTWEKTIGRGFFGTLSSLTLNPISHVFMNKLIKLSDAIVCVSKSHKAILTKADESFKYRVHTIYNPLPHVSPIDVKGADFGYLGGSNYLKGFLVLFKALERINRDGCKSINVHATKFSHFSGCNSLFVRGFKVHANLQSSQFEELLKKVRCIIVPSIFPETFSYATVEALLRRQLVIASDVGAIPEVASGCEGAFLFPPGDYEQLAKKILYVKDLDNETVISLGKRNRETTLSKFSNEKVITKFMNLLNLVLEK